MTQKLVPDSFEVPETVASSEFRLEVLEPMVAEIDYEVVMASRKRLRSVFDEHDDWPSDTMTLEYNISDLERHLREFKARFAFAYTVREPDGDGYWGCVYINPSTSDFDAEVFVWVSDEEVSRDESLYLFVREWLANDWPFTRVAYPGREISWDKWHELSGR